MVSNSGIDYDEVGSILIKNVHNIDTNHKSYPQKLSTHGFVPGNNKT